MTKSSQESDLDALSGRAKPRGSRSGIIVRQALSVERTSKSLAVALEKLIVERPASRITEAALCKLAGLKSTIALHSKVNEALHKKLLDHNNEVSMPPRLLPAPQMSIEDIKKQLLLRDAEVSDLLAENRRLKRQLDHERQRS